MVELYLHSPVCPHGIILDELNTGTTYLYLSVSAYVGKGHGPRIELFFEYNVL
jgi:hypothetical protein